MIHTNSFTQTNSKVLPSFSRAGNYRETVLFPRKMESGRVAMHHARYARDKEESGLYNPCRTLL